MSISLDLLQNFRMVAEKGNITAAAQMLGVTQSSLSWSMQKLERQIGTELLLRSKKGVTLTRSGRILLARSAALIRDWEGIGQAIITDREEVMGTYSIGMHPTVGMITLPRFLPRLLEAHPKLDLKLVHDRSRAVARKVIDHELDFGLVINPPDHPDLVISELYDDRVCFWSAQAGRRAGMPGEPVFCHPQMPQTDLLVGEARRRRLLTGERLVYTDQLTVILSLVESGSGLGIMPASLVRHRSEGRVFTLEDSPLYRDRCCLIWRHEGRGGTAAGLIREGIRESLINLTAAGAATG